MKHALIRSFLLAVLASSALLAMAVPGSVSAAELRPMAADGRLLLEVTDGLFLISGTDGDKLRVSGPDDDLVAPAEISGTAEAWTLRFEGTASDDPIFIQLPRSAELEIQGDQARLVVVNMAGPRLQIQTGSGAVHIDQSQPQRLVIDSMSGPMRLKSLGRRETRLSSLDGAIDASGQSERLRVRTLSGSLYLAVSDLLDLDAETLSGQLDARLNPLDDAVLRARTHSGATRLSLPADSGLDLRAESHSGQISSDFGGEPAPGQGSNKRLTHRSGGGAIRAELRSVDGPITVSQYLPTARVLVFREPQTRSPSRAFGRLRDRSTVPIYAGRVDFGVDGQRRASLRPGQYAEFDLPLDAGQVFARHSGVRDPVELEVVSLEPILYCFQIGAFGRWAGSPEAPSSLVGFEMSHVPCPEPADLVRFDRVQVD